MRTTLPIMDPTKEEIEYYKNNEDPEQKYMKLLYNGVVTSNSMADLKLGDIFVILNKSDSYYKVTSKIFIDSTGIPMVSYKKINY